MLNFMKCTATLATLLLTGTAYSGAVSSGGGTKLMKWASNPWWLENTTRVTYCIDRDVAFPIGDKRLSELVEEGLSKWQHAFSTSESRDYSNSLEPFSKIRLATQTFEETRCNTSTDLRFRFGQLKEADQKHLDAPEDYFGATVRTNYDKTNLRSQGFVYIAPLTGSGRPNSVDISPDAWTVCNNCILKVVLWHEIGHIFGIDHDDSSLMDEYVGRKLTTRLNVLRYKASELSGGRSTSRLLADADPMNHFAGYQERTLENCDHRAMFAIEREFFDLPQASCYRFTYRLNEIEVTYSLDQGRSWDIAGRVEWHLQNSLPTWLVQVYLPQEQQVFTKYPKDPTTATYLSGPEGKFFWPLRPVYITKGGVKKIMKLQSRGWNSFTAEGVHRDEIVAVDLTRKGWSAPQERSETSAPRDEILREVLTRWNAVALGITVPGDPQSNFIWPDLNSFPHPTFRRGTNAAYVTFEEILVKFYETGDNMAFLKKHNLLNYQFKMILNGHTSFRYFESEYY